VVDVNLRIRKTELLVGMKSGLTKNALWTIFKERFYKTVKSFPKCLETKWVILILMVLDIGTSVIRLITKFRVLILKSILSNQIVVLEMTHSNTKKVIWFRLSKIKQTLRLYKELIEN
jgi:hypothetical protein